MTKDSKNIVKKMLGDLGNRAYKDLPADSFSLPDDVDQMIRQSIRRAYQQTLDEPVPDRLLRSIQKHSAPEGGSSDGGAHQ